MFLLLFVYLFIFQAAQNGSEFHLSSELYYNSSHFDDERTQTKIITRFTEALKITLPTCIYLKCKSENMTFKFINESLRAGTLNVTEEANTVSEYSSRRLYSKLTKNYLTMVPRIRDQVLILSFNLVISAANTTANAAWGILSSVVKRTAEQLNGSLEEFLLYDFKIYDISVQCPAGLTHAKKYNGTCGKETSLNLYTFFF